jgi:hypothetical protein
MLNSQVWIAGDLQVQNLALNNWQFASSLSGKINLDTHQSLPVNLEGDNTQITANRSGNWENIQAKGEMSFSEVRLNGENLANIANITNIKGGFNYGNSRLAISTIEPDNFQVFTKPVPPFPGNEQFSLNVQIQEDLRIFKEILALELIMNFGFNLFCLFCLVDFALFVGWAEPYPPYSVATVLLH